MFIKRFGPSSSAKQRFLPSQRSIGLDGLLERAEEAFTCRESVEHGPSGLVLGCKMKKAHMLQWLWSLLLFELF